MKKYFALAFIILVVLLLVLRKQTEPVHFRNTSPEAAQVETATATAPVAESAPAPASAPVRSTVGTGAPAAGDEKLSPEAVLKLRSIAKNYLASGYAAQTAIKAEWDRYSSDLIAMGWEPNEPEMNFKFGFLAPLNEKPYDDHEKPERSSTDAFVNQDSESSNQRFRYTSTADKLRLADYSRYCAQGCVATTTGFEWIILVPLDDKRVDVWTMNEKKELKLAHDGTTD